MICKKCNADIADTSKFCGYCGSAVEILNVQPNNYVNNEAETMQNTMVNNVTENDLGKTIKVEPIPSDTLINPTPVMNNYQGINQMPVNNMGVPNNKKSNKLIFIIGGIVLGVIAIVLAIVAFMKLSDDNSVVVLEKALTNLENVEAGITLDANVSFAAKTGESMSLSATIKAQKKNDDKDDKLDMSITVNESLLFDEMNVYASVTDDDVTLYAESSLIDMLGMTTSETPMWLHYTMLLDEIADTSIDDADEIEDLDLSIIIDNKHFVYVEETNGLKHYQLIIDQALIDNMKSKSSKIEDDDLRDMINSMETLEETIYLDFYITETNDLSKIQLDMSDYLDGTELSSFVISLGFRDINSTKVEIPTEALNSNMDLETYTTTYAIQDDYDYGYDYDSSLDSDIDYDYDFDYDSSWDSDMSNDWY